MHTVADIEGDSYPVNRMNMLVRCVHQNHVSNFIIQ